MKKQLIMMLLLSLIFLTLPALAMMHRSGHMHGEKDTEKPLQKQDKGVEERQTGHRHGEYYHSHEGGELPHSHYQEKSAPSEHDQITYEEMPSITSPVPPREMEVHTQQDALQVPLPDQEKTVISRRDDMIMHLVPEGQLLLPGIAGTMEVKKISGSLLY